MTSLNARPALRGKSEEAYEAAVQSVGGQPIRVGQRLWPCRFYQAWPEQQQVRQQVVILRPAGRGVLGLLAGQQTSGRLWCSPFLPNRVTYHWRELPQVSFLSRQTFCACLSRQNTFLLFLFSRQKHAIVLSLQIFVVTNVSLSRQNFCRDKLTFVATNTSFVATKECFSNTFSILQVKFCRGKHTFVATKDVFYRDKHALQNFCRDKNDTCGSSRMMVTRCSHPLPLYPTACLLSQTVVLPACSLRSLAYLRGSQAESNDSLLPGKQCCWMCCKWMSCWMCCKWMCRWMCCKW